MNCGFVALMLTSYIGVCAVISGARLNTRTGVSEGFEEDSMLGLVYT